MRNSIAEIGGENKTDDGIGSQFWSKHRQGQALSDYRGSEPMVNDADFEKSRIGGHLYCSQESKIETNKE